MKARSHFPLALIYLLGVALRLYPRLLIDPHLLTFQGDIWYRLAMAQYILDHHALPEPDLRYLAYGSVPMWYPPLSPLSLAALSYALNLDLPTLCSRVMPFIEALSPITIFYLARHMYDELAGYAAALTLALTPTFIFWTAISDPQSLTLFLIPLYLLLWLKHWAKRERRNILILSLALAVNFLFHLSYFVAILVLLSTTLALLLSRKTGAWLLRDLMLVIMASQLLTSPWWLPRNLYWWWIKALVTSSGLYSVSWQIGDYGALAALLGAISLCYVAFRDREWRSFILLWSIPLLLESQNEAILHVINRPDLAWTTLAKPLEGFRFFPYLAQPAALAVGGAFSRALKACGRLAGRGLATLALLLLATALLYNLLGPYNLIIRLQTSGLTPAEYRAALWYRENTGSRERIAADYYRAQMLSGVTGGRALDGGMFPLRNVDLPYISVPAKVQDDLYVLYTTPEARTAHEIAGRYGVTHVFYSLNMELYGNLLSSYRPASEYGVPVSLEKFYNTTYFKLVYEDEAGDVRIFQVL